MATTVSDRTVIYSSSAVQGAVVVVFAAFTPIFVAASHYDLTLAQYGALFVPQIIAAVVAALFAAKMGSWLRAKRAYRAGLSCSLAGTAMMGASEWTERLPPAYPLLLAATALAGTGIGLTFPYLRSYAVSLKPLRARRQILLINALLAAGMTTAPVYVLLTRGTGGWWSLPALLVVLLVAEMLVSGSLRAPPDGAPARRADRPVPGRFLAYPGLALLFGMCAVSCLTAPQYLTGHVPSSHQFHLFVLAAVGFWPALVAGGRVLFGVIDGMKTRQHLASIGVFMIGITLLVLSATLIQYEIMYIGTYLLAGIGCAALLPVDTRPGNEDIAALPLAVTFGVMALYPVGLGLSRFAYIDIQRAGLSVFEAFISVAVLGAAACVLILPIILSWRMMGYSDLPPGRSSGLPALRRSGIAGEPAAPAPGTPPRQRGRSDHDGGYFEPGGATALPDGKFGSSGEHDQLPGARDLRPPSLRSAPRNRSSARAPTIASASAAAASPASSRHLVRSSPAASASASAHQAASSALSATHGRPAAGWPAARRSAASALAASRHACRTVRSARLRRSRPHPRSSAASVAGCGAGLTFQIVAAGALSGSLSAQVACTGLFARAADASATGTAAGRRRRGRRPPTPAR